MTQTDNKKCLNCGGIVEFDPNTQTLVCQYCQSEFPLDYDDTITKKEDIDYCNSMNEYICQSCGAKVVIDENTASTTCVYCHSNIALLGKLSGDIKPDKIIPFAFDQDEAKKIFLDKVKTMKFIPNSYFSSEQLNNIQGIYYPFWIVDADIDTEAEFLSERISTRTSGNYNYTTRSVYSNTRSGNIKLEDVPSCAISDVDNQMLEAILPFPFNKYKDFNPSYLAGFISKKRDLDKSDLTAGIHEKIKDLSIQKLRSTVTNVTTVMKSTHKINKEDWSYVLLPIYLLTYTKNNKTYTFAINGYTRKIYGQYPVSNFKVFGLVFIIMIITIILGVVGGILW